MKKAKSWCAGKCITVPTEQGFYWATEREANCWGKCWSGILWIGKNGHGHLRAYTPGRYGYMSKNITDFTDWHGPLTDPRPARKSKPSPT